MKNALYAQSGGVTAVINASACGLIETTRQYPTQIQKIYAGKNGILGILHEELIDTADETPEDIAALKFTPGGAFGSCRYKLKGLEENRAEYERLIEVFSAHNIGYFFYNGGGDSQDTAHKISEMGLKLGYPITCIGIPKTIDNDLPYTDSSPGFGSVAKYVAISTREAGLDVASMASSSTKVFILEVMGRHAGWIAAAAGLASENPDLPPHLILFPELPFVESDFCNHVKESVEKNGYCVVVASEGIRKSDGSFLSESGLKDAFGHAQLGGVAPALAAIIKQNLNLKYHWAVSDYLQRSARHIASTVDVTQAYDLGKSAVELALAGKNAVMPIIVRDNDSPYKWHIEDVALSKVANQEKTLPKDFIRSDGFGITEACRDYLLPLIQGEAYPPYHEGMPCYVRLKNNCIPKKLAPFLIKK
ncbi:MAG TPA: 6-phosphofructokinase [Gammaproteobacteria bacterium]|nr:6-phosphofructokinase [Gammaproteobacteria bacterium]